MPLRDGWDDGASGQALPTAVRRCGATPWCGPGGPFHLHGSIESGFGGVLVRLQPWKLVPRESHQAARRLWRWVGAMAASMKENAPTRRHLALPRQPLISR